MKLTKGHIKVEAGIDAVHVNDSAEVTEANLTLTAGDDAITVKNDENTGVFTMNGGTVSVSSCAEGIEAGTVNISGGTADIAFTDDGINAYTEEGELNVSGGDISVVCENASDSDGFDSNGSISLTGGNIVIGIGNDNMSGAFDVGEQGGTCTIDGATVMAFSGQGTDSRPESSTQGIISTQISGEAGTAVKLEVGGKNLFDSKAPCSFTTVLLSSPELKTGESCNLTVGESTQTVEAQSQAESGGIGMKGGRGRMMQDNQNGSTKSPNGFENTSPDKRGGFVENPDGTSSATPT